jgi:hypothetical protein
MGRPSSAPTRGVARHQHAGPVASHPRSLPLKLRPQAGSLMRRVRGAARELVRSLIREARDGNPSAMPATHAADVPAPQINHIAGSTRGQSQPRPRHQHRASLTALAAYLVLLSLLGACDSDRPAHPEAQPGPPTTATVLPVIPSPTPIPPPGAVFILSDDTPEWMADQLTSSVEAAAQESGLPVRLFNQAPSSSDLASAEIIVAASPYPHLAELIEAAGSIPILAVGYAQPFDGVLLSNIILPADQPLRRAFLAGYLAAIITPDWRTAVLTPDQTIAQAFTNGMRYYCGLCRPAFPPFHALPLTQILLSQPAPEQLNLAAQTVIDDRTTLIFIEAGLLNPAVTQSLEERQVSLITTEPESDTQSFPATWTASIVSDLTPAFIAAWKPALNRSPLDQVIGLTVVVGHSGEISPGRLALFEETLLGVNQGWIVPVTEQ